MADDAWFPFIAFVLLGFLIVGLAWVAQKLVDNRKLKAFDSAQRKLQAQWRIDNPCEMCRLLHYKNVPSAGAHGMDRTPLCYFHMAQADQREEAFIRDIAEGRVIIPPPKKDEDG